MTVQLKAIVLSAVLCLWVVSTVVIGIELLRGGTGIGTSLEHLIKNKKE